MAENLLMKRKDCHWYKMYTLYYFVKLTITSEINIKDFLPLALGCPSADSFGLASGFVLIGSGRLLCLARRGWREGSGGGRGRRRGAWGALGRLSRLLISLPADYGRGRLPQLVWAAPTWKRCSDRTAVARRNCLAPINEVHLNQLVHLHLDLVHLFVSSSSGCVSAPFGSGQRRGRGILTVRSTLTILEAKLNLDS